MATPEHLAQLDRLKEMRQAGELNEAQLKRLSDIERSFAGTILETAKEEDALTPAQEKKIEGLNYTPLGSFTRGAVKELTLSFGDEIGGFIQGVLDPDRSISQAIEEIRAKDVAAEEQNPGSFLGGQVTGGVGSALIPGGALFQAGRGASLGARAAQAAGVGAGIEGVRAIGGNVGDIEERVQPNVAGSALLGGAFGAASPYVGAGARAAYRKALPRIRKVKGLSKKATDILLDALDKSSDPKGRTFSEVVQDLGPEATIADLGRGTRDIAAAVAAAGGPQARGLAAGLAERSRGAPGRIEDALGELGARGTAGRARGALDLEEELASRQAQQVAAAPEPAPVGGILGAAREAAKVGGPQTRKTVKPYTDILEGERRVTSATATQRFPPRGIPEPETPPGPTDLAAPPQPTAVASQQTYPNPFAAERATAAARRENQQRILDANKPGIVATTGAPALEARAPRAETDISVTDEGTVGIQRSVPSEPERLNLIEEELARLAERRGDPLQAHLTEGGRRAQAAQSAREADIGRTADRSRAVPDVPVAAQAETSALFSSGQGLTGLEHISPDVLTAVARSRGIDPSQVRALEGRVDVAREVGPGMRARTTEGPPVLLSQPRGDPALSDPGPSVDPTGRRISAAQPTITDLIASGRKARPSLEKRRRAAANVHTDILRRREAEAAQAAAAAEREALLQQQQQAFQSAVPEGQEAAAAASSRELPPGVSPEDRIAQQQRAQASLENIAQQQQRSPGGIPAAPSGVRGPDEELLGQEVGEALSNVRSTEGLDRFTRRYGPAAGRPVARPGTPPPAPVSPPAPAPTPPATTPATPVLDAPVDTKTPAERPYHLGDVVEFGTPPVGRMPAFSETPGGSALFGAGSSPPVPRAPEPSGDLADAGLRRLAPETRRTAESILRAGRGRATTAGLGSIIHDDLGPGGLAGIGRQPGHLPELPEGEVPLYESTASSVRRRRPVAAAPPTIDEGTRSIVLEDPEFKDAISRYASFVDDLEGMSIRTADDIDILPGDDDAAARFLREQEGPQPTGFEDVLEEGDLGTEAEQGLLGRITDFLGDEEGSVNIGGRRAQTAAGGRQGLSPQLVHNMRQELEEQISSLRRRGQNERANQLEPILERMNESLQGVPGLEAVTQQRAGVEARRRAIDTGTNSLLTGKKAVPADKIRAAVEEMSDQERTYFLAGVREHLDNVQDVNQDNLKALNRVLGTKRGEEVIKAALPGPQGSALLGRVHAETVFEDTRKAVEKADSAAARKAAREAIGKGALSPLSTQIGLGLARRMLFGKGKQAADFGRSYDVEGLEAGRRVLDLRPEAAEGFGTFHGRVPRGLKPQVGAVLQLKGAERDRIVSEFDKRLAKVRSPDVKAAIVELMVENATRAAGAGAIQLGNNQ